MPNNQTKAMTQGAMMIALFLILLTLAFYVPVINLLAFVFAPLPLAWFSATYNRKLAIGISLLAVAASILIGNLLIVPLALILAIVGLVMGDCLREKKSKIYLLMATGTAVLLTFALQFILLVHFLNVNFIEKSMQLAQDTYSESLEYSAQITGGEAQMEEQLKQAFDMMEMALPATITISIFVLAFIWLLVLLPILKRLKVEVPKFPPFRDMRLPRAILWYYLIVLSINLFVQPEYGSAFYVVMLNLSIILWVLLTVQGISLIHFVIDAFHYPRFLKVLATIVAVPMYSFVVLVGIIDLGFNLREWIKAKSEK
ncbi:YybS family protein [Lysinibacillus odysseyi]|uniref:Membrane protein n=1 Tax=Lysinibacillus odysseyi 34hs-1 = NBRC 100172 TaxID=1220589 RepID=A0A0A3ITQ4_9BACI|nr:YybS family protein [Lysinibacillus odysseyi]KGR86805.1 membrane protein [Lysinibacillus odysseyi 34hs-1 = NBRC 100172]